MGLMQRFLEMILQVDGLMASFPASAQAAPAGWVKCSVLQRLIVGYEGEYEPQGGATKPSASLQRLLGWSAAGLGGIIFFRENMAHLERAAMGVEVAGEQLEKSETVAQTRQSLREMLQAFQRCWGKTPAVGDAPESWQWPWLAIDQEGGRVERLVPPLFPTVPHPYYLSEAFAQGHADWVTDSSETLARALKTLGFNLNFYPTLDVNHDPRNPVIGTRAYGKEPACIRALLPALLTPHLEAGVMPVVKHFPGHGHGAVDSHLDLPILYSSPEDQTPFYEALMQGAPAVLVAHGLYPEWMDMQAQPLYPATLSREVIRPMLREQAQFDGLVISDDMAMGAIAKHFDPVEAACAAIAAGNDLLVYQFAHDGVAQVVDGVTEALRSGQLDWQEHLRSLARIDTAKQRFCRPETLPLEGTDHVGKVTVPAYPHSFVLPMPLSKLGESAGSTSDLLGSPAVGEASGLDITAYAAVVLVHPAREQMKNYAVDAQVLPDLDAVMQERVALLRGACEGEGVAFYALRYTDNAEGVNTSLNASQRPLREIAGAVLWVVVTWLPHAGHALLETGTLRSMLMTQWGRIPQPGDGGVMVSAGVPPEHTTVKALQAEGSVFSHCAVRHVLLGQYRGVAWQDLCDWLFKRG